MEIKALKLRGEEMSVDRERRLWVSGQQTSPPPPFLHHRPRLSAPIPEIGAIAYVTRDLRPGIVRHPPPTTALL